jgi:hypothetical protein
MIITPFASIMFGFILFLIKWVLFPTMWVHHIIGISDVDEISYGRIVIRDKFLKSFVKYYTLLLNS